MLRLFPPFPPKFNVGRISGGVPKGKKLCHEAHGPRSVINIEIGGAGVSVDVHRTLVDVTVLRLYLKGVAKFLLSTEGHADFTFTEVEI